MTVHYARVAVNVPLHQLFTYAVPEGERAEPGCRVRVPFGPRRLVGVVVEQTTEPPAEIAPEKVRPLEAVLDKEPVLSPLLMDLCGWMSSYYHVSPGEAYLLPLPPAMTGGRKGEPREHRYRTELIARLGEVPRGEQRLGTAMARALLYVEEHGLSTLSDIREATGAGRDVLKRLAARDLLTLEERRVHRDPFRREPLESDVPPTLTGEQADAVAAVQGALGSYQGFLLLGVTGSGKTEVYLHLIDAVLSRGEGALVLVPEIALTPQLVSRFRARLGTRIAVLHSALDPGARHEQWLRIASGELPVVIGARSAVFAPVPNLGLIVVDEEHDGSFKQDTSPRYHGRDLALMRGHNESCPVLLGTATPSLESWANVSRDKMRLLRLTQRVEKRPMPEVKLLDLRQQAFLDRERIFSRALIEEIQANLERDEQTILLINRRGFAAWILCRSCGEALTCPACSVSYTWHRQRNQLECHYCGRLERLPVSCPHCKKDGLQEMGFGTERVEEILKALLPTARIARMDRDTTRGHALTRLLGAFRRREIDVLVGTQMVAKGHDFPGVTLVGVLLAETGLRLPDFRAAERTFQLMTQIAGRAGRAHRAGRVLIQTYMPEHYSLVHASTHASEAFLEDELSMREFREFPPLSHLALFRVESTDQDAAWAISGRLIALLAATVQEPGPADVEVQGPRLAPVERIKERWRIQILVRSVSRTRLSSVLSAVMELLTQESIPSRVSVSLDVDPHSFL